LVSVPAQMGQFDFDERLCFVELVHDSDHWKHQPQATPAGRAQQRTYLAAQEARPVESEPDRTPAQRWIFLIYIAQIGQDLVAADIEGAEGHRLFSGGIEHCAIERALFAGAWQRRRDHELQFGAEQTDSSRAGVLDMRKVDGQPGIDHQLDFLTVLGDAWPVTQRPVLCLPAGAQLYPLAIGCLNVLWR